MIFGSFVVAFCLLILGWTAEIVGWFVTDPEKVCCEELVRNTIAAPVLTVLQTKNLTIALAVSSIYAVDFSINVGE